MSTLREKSYRCTLVTSTRRLTGHVRAWNEREAALHFREELAIAGVASRGQILVERLSGVEAPAAELATP